MSFRPHPAALVVTVLVLVMGAAAGMLADAEPIRLALSLLAVAVLSWLGGLVAWRLGGRSGTVASITMAAVAGLGSVVVGGPALGAWQAERWLAEEEARLRGESRRQALAAAFADASGERASQVAERLVADPDLEGRLEAVLDVLEAAEARRRASRASVRALQDAGGTGIEGLDDPDALEIRRRLTDEALADHRRLIAGFEAIPETLRTAQGRVGHGEAAAARLLVEAVAAHPGRRASLQALEAEGAVLEQWMQVLELLREEQGAWRWDDERQAVLFEDPEATERFLALMPDATRQDPDTALTAL